MKPNKNSKFRSKLVVNPSIPYPWSNWCPFRIPDTITQLLQSTCCFKGCLPTFNAQESCFHNSVYPWDINGSWICNILDMSRWAWPHPFKLDQFVPAHNIFNLGMWLSNTFFSITGPLSRHLLHLQQSIGLRFHMQKFLYFFS